MTYHYLIAMGSNLGELEDNIALAVVSLQEALGRLLKCSANYVTDPEGEGVDRIFLNAACLVESDLPPLQAISELLNIEYRMGRRRLAGLQSNRIIDLDIVLAKRQPSDEYVISEDPQLLLPHPRAHERGFVMIPAAEVCPDWRFPHSREKSLVELALQFPPLKVASKMS